MEGLSWRRRNVPEQSPRTWRSVPCNQKNLPNSSEKSNRDGPACFFKQRKKEPFERKSSNSKHQKENLPWQRTGVEASSYEWRSRSKVDNYSDRESATSFGSSDSIFSEFGTRRKRTSRSDSESDIYDNNSIFDDDLIDTMNEETYHDFLADLLGKEPHQLIAEIENSNLFFDYLSTAELPPKILLKVFRILKKVGTVEKTDDSEKIATRICQTQLLHAISFFLGELVVVDGISPQEINVFFEDLIDFYDLVINLDFLLINHNLSISIEKLIEKTKMSVKLFNSGLKNEDSVPDGIIDRLEDLKNWLETNRTSDSDISSYFYENIRLRTYPTDEDFQPGFHPPLQPNKLKGAYDNVEHYLYVQFQLLREDFMRALRDQVGEFKLRDRQTSEMVTFPYEYRGKGKHIRYLSQEGVVKFFDRGRKVSGFEKISRWEAEKRFLPGSLILLTKNNLKTFTCATVRRKGPCSLMRVNYITSWKLCTEENVNDEIDSYDFIMYGSDQYNFTEPSYESETLEILESNVYYRPYLIVMDALKTINDENFPMRKYIVDGETSPRYPEYLRTLVTYDVLGHKVNPLRLESWPSASELGFDEHQYRAFTCALTREFSVTQGPPGTGKTYLGLKIAEVLLKNARLQPQSIRMPIVVVCYTNHALDQFLEGILKKTEEVVRIGLRSRHAILNMAFNLHSGCRSASLKRIAEEKFKDYWTLNSLLAECSEKTALHESKLSELNDPIGILSVQIIHKFMNDREKEILQSDDDVTSWLLDFSLQGTETLKKNDSELKNYLKTIENEILNTVYIDSENECIFGVTLINLKTYLEKKLATLEYLRENDHAVDGSDFEIRLALNQNATETNAKNEVLELWRQYNLLKTKLKEYSENDFNEKKILNLKDDLQNLPLNSRWNLYWKWFRQYKAEVSHNLIKLKIEKKNLEFKKGRGRDGTEYQELFVLQNSLVVGLTTSGAANSKYRELLQILQPSIIIVEEAAQVNEAHVVASLTKDCQHVILIGDHKQLRPSVATYELAKHYHMDVSLFERMVNNGMDCPSLKIQHRMRPEIASLITPLIYPCLTNHRSVLEFESIKGVTKNLFFLDHKELESADNKTKSKKNVFEARFMIEFCHYLVLQGYSPNNITILTTYKDQLTYLRKKYIDPGVKCVVVDKYQGEENDIVLLSLVRSNKDGKIGYLGVSNRICVALSRARKGLYMIGNMELLSRSKLWANINETLKKQDAIGDSLALSCQNHSTFAVVSSAEDFVRVPLGGCREICKKLMPCGHNCSNACHVIDPDHVQFSKECKELCTRKCPRSHPCKLLCYKVCKNCDELVEMTLPCNHKFVLPCRTNEEEYVCTVKFDAILPVCGHQVQRLCQQKLEDVTCPIPCEETLGCGHLCPSTCHKNKKPNHSDVQCRRPCDKVNEHCPKGHRCQNLCFQTCEDHCSVNETFHLDCGHDKLAPCSTNVATLQCRRRCEKICENCNQRCRKNCGVICQPCNNEVQKVIPECKHQLTLACWEEPKREKCEAACQFTAPCGHKCKLKCGEPCDPEKCSEMIKFYDVKPLCGHNYINIECYKQKDVSNLNMGNFLERCDVPCNAVLECGHTCSGTCGQCWEGRFHVACEEPCQKILLCGHMCKAPCRVICPPCEEICTYQCKHSKCSLLCGDNCSPCQEPCEYKCSHSACTRVCGAHCDRKPCNLVCEKLLEKCGHPCMGFCGEPCPPVCRLCDSEKLKEIIFGWKDDENARCVILEDCGHIIESETMVSFTSSLPTGTSIKQIHVKGCPQCTKPIPKTLRYPMKQAYTFLRNISRMVFMDEANMLTCRRRMFQEFQNLSCESRDKLKHKRIRCLIIRMIDQYRDKMKLTKQKNEGTAVSRQQLAAMTYYHEVFAIIINLSDTLSQCSISRSCTKVVRRFIWLAERIDQVSVDITRQQILDINGQLWQYEKMVDFCRLEASINSNPDFSVSRDQLESVLFKYTKLTLDDKCQAENLLNFFRENVLDRSLRPHKSIVESSYRLNNYYAETSCAGKWFICSRGHFFCYLESNDYNVDYKCPKCFSL